MMSETFEPFVDAQRVAEFLSMTKAQVLKLTRSGSIRAYPVSGIERHVWKYRLSEVAEDIAARRKPARSTMGLGSPQSSVTKERYGTE